MEQAGATYHVVARGVDRRRIFVDDVDYDEYTRLLGAVTDRQRWHLLCYCLMPNHVHLMVETPETNLGNGMQWLHGRYARAFNVRHERTGHLFEAPYHSPMVTTEAAFVRTVGYIAANPVKAALCQTPSEWRWSSQAAVSADSPPEWLGHNRLLERLGEMLCLHHCHDDFIVL